MRTLKKAVAFVVSMVEHAPYQVIRKAGRLEIRRYPSLLLAAATGSDDDAAFNLLFRYISGDNQSRQKIPMTAPVISGEHIPLSSPVIFENFEMAFVLPSSYTKETAPVPTDRAVRIVQTQPRSVAVLRFSGKPTSREVATARRQLEVELERHRLVAMDTPFLMRYNSPFMPGFLKRNELAVELPAGQEEK